MNFEYLNIVVIIIVFEWLASHTWLCAWGSLVIACITFIIGIIRKKNKGNNMHIGDVGNNSNVNQSGGDININAK